jgi:hypothetical protein
VRRREARADGGCPDSPACGCRRGESISGAGPDATGDRARAPGATRSGHASRSPQGPRSCCAVHPGRPEQAAAQAGSRRRSGTRARTGGSTEGNPGGATPAAAPLDLKSLEARLRQTKAIGVLTKLSLKNQVDDLVDGFRAYHKRQGTATLANLRRNYDMLFLKVLSLLQDSDPSLARDIVKSRGAIWSILEDPRKFTESNLMAGATP